MATALQVGARRFARWACPIGRIRSVPLMAGEIVLVRPVVSLLRDEQVPGRLEAAGLIKCPRCDAHQVSFFGDPEQARPTCRAERSAGVTFTARTFEPAQRRVWRYVQLMSLNDSASTQAAMPASAVVAVAEEHFSERGTHLVLDRSAQATAGSFGGVTAFHG